MIGWLRTVRSRNANGSVYGMVTVHLRDADRGLPAKSKSVLGQTRGNMVAQRLGVPYLVPADWALPQSSQGYG